MQHVLQVLPFALILLYILVGLRLNYRSDRQHREACDRAERREMDMHS
jgi:hypothetical protein